MGIVFWLAPLMGAFVRWLTADVAVIALVGLGILLVNLVSLWVFVRRDKERKELTEVSLSFVVAVFRVGFYYTLAVLMTGALLRR